MKAGPLTGILAALIVARADLVPPVLAADAPAAGFGAGVASVIGDSWITAVTRLRLLGDGRTRAMDIGVETRDGVVTLSGTVTSTDAKVAAGEEARKAHGVRTVMNQLEVVEVGRGGEGG